MFFQFRYTDDQKYNVHFIAFWIFCNSANQYHDQDNHKHANRILECYQQRIFKINVQLFSIWRACFQRTHKLIHSNQLTLYVKYDKRKPLDFSSCGNNSSFDIIITSCMFNVAKSATKSKNAVCTIQITYELLSFNLKDSWSNKQTINTLQ